MKSERNLPLKNMEFVILGQVSTPKEDLKKDIVKMGGKVTTKIHNKLAAVISTQGINMLILIFIILILHTVLSGFVSI